MMETFQLVSSITKLSNVSFRSRACWKTFFRMATTLFCDFDELLSSDHNKQLEIGL